MTIQVEDDARRAAFRQEFRDWLLEVQSAWVGAIDAGDEDAYKEARKAAEADGWNLFSWMHTIGSSGYGAPLWPKEYGGLSGEPWMQMIIREELGRYRFPSFSVNILGVGLAGPTIVTHGTAAQKERYLKNILTGKEIWCQLFSEPGSGSDLASLATRAVRVGDEWIINGQKVWTSIAQISHYGLLLARTDPDVHKHAGLTYFILDMHAPGVDIRPLRQITGSAEFNEVYLTDVRIADYQRVGDIGEGWRCARTTLANERDTIAGMSLDMTSVLGGTRKDPWESFLDGIGDRSDRVMRQHVAQVYIEQRTKDATVARANTARMLGEQPGPEGSVNKMFNAEFNQRRAALVMNAAGPASIAWLPGDGDAESRAHGFLRARANTIEGGTSEVLRNSVAERVLGLPREPELDREIAWKDVKRN
ncbi:MAG: acyl-CoA dehydrogenase family protein [Actinomycetota bacterium]